jgi:hypothetical protein
MVTAEPFATVNRPTELVVFVSGEVQGQNKIHAQRNHY